MTERPIPSPVPRDVPRDVPREKARDVVHDDAHIRSISDSRAPLFDDHEGHGLRARWEAIQTGFVDEPRAAVEQADALVNQVMSRLTQVFADERTALEQQWTRGDNVSTEELRVALKRYRSFFERLLSL